MEGERGVTGDFGERPVLPGSGNGGYRMRVFCVVVSAFGSALHLGFRGGNASCQTTGRWPCSIAIQHRNRRCDGSKGVGGRKLPVAFPRPTATSAGGGSFRLRSYGGGLPGGSAEMATGYQKRLWHARKLSDAGFLHRTLQNGSPEAVMGLCSDGVG